MLVLFALILIIVTAFINIMMPMKVEAFWRNIVSRWWFIYLGILSLLLVVVLSLDFTFKMFQPQNFQNIVAELNGLLLDAFIFIFLVTFYERNRSRRDDIRRLQEELQDIKHWQGEEASFRKIGIIKRLIALNVSKIDLTGFNFQVGNVNALDFSKLTLGDNTFSNFIFQNIVFDSRKLKDVTFEKCDLKKVQFNKTPLLNVEILETKFSDVVFNECDVSTNDFIKASFDKTHFVKCDLEFTVFKECRFERPILFSDCKIRGTRWDGCSFWNYDSKELVEELNATFGEQEVKAHILSKYEIVNYPTQPAKWELRDGKTIQVPAFSLKGCYMTKPIPEMFPSVNSIQDMWRGLGGQ